MKEATEIEVLTSDPQHLDKMKKGATLYFARPENPVNRQSLGQITHVDNTRLQLSTHFFDNDNHKQTTKIGDSLLLFSNQAEGGYLGKAYVMRCFFMPVTRNDWKVKKLITPANAQPIDFEVNISTKAKAFLELGIYPLSMDHKWFMFCENNEFHFLRSWTGIEFYSGKFIEADNNQWCIAQVITTKTWEVDLTTKNEMFESLITWQLHKAENVSN